MTNQAVANIVQVKSGRIWKPCDFTKIQSKYTMKSSLSHQTCLIHMEKVNVNKIAKLTSE